MIQINWTWLRLLKLKKTGYRSLKMEYTGAKKKKRLIKETERESNNRYR